MRSVAEKFLGLFSALNPESTTADDYRKLETVLGQVYDVCPIEEIAAMLEDVKARGKAKAKSELLESLQYEVTELNTKDQECQWTLVQQSRLEEIWKKTDAASCGAELKKALAKAVERLEEEATEMLRRAPQPDELQRLPALFDLSGSMAQVLSVQQDKRR